MAAPPPVASIGLSAPVSHLTAGDEVPLSVVPLDREGRRVSDVAVSFTSDPESVARVDADGVVTALSAGYVTIRAQAAGVTGELTLRVEPGPTEAGVAPAFATLATGETLALRASGATAWSSNASGVASVAADGTVTAGTPGVAEIVARAGERADTAVVAVLGPASLLSTAFAAGTFRAAAEPGASLAVPITLDLSRLGSEGDLGAVELDLLFDPAVLELRGVTSALKGATDHHVVEPGRLRFAFAGTAAQGQPLLVLAEIAFQVRAGAPAGAETALRLSFPARPVGTSLAPLELPIAVGGRIRVVSP